MTSRVLSALLAERRFWGHVDVCVQCQSYRQVVPGPLCPEGQRLWADYNLLDIEPPMEMPPVQSVDQQILEARIRRLEGVIHRMDTNMLSVICPSCQRDNDDYWGMDAAEWKRLVAEAAA